MRMNVYLRHSYTANTNKTMFDNNSCNNNSISKF